MERLVAREMMSEGVGWMAEVCGKRPNQQEKTFGGE
jgi:hypothetical protein